MDRLRFIPRIAIWALEVGVVFMGIGLIISGIKMFFIDSLSDRDGSVLFSNGLLFIPIFFGLFYLACAIVIFLGYIFNWLTDYEDFDDFSDMCHGMSMAPFYVIKFVFTHFFRIFKLLFTGDTD